MNKYILIVIIILSMSGIFFYINFIKDNTGNNSIKKFNIRREEALKTYMKKNNIKDKDLVNYLYFDNYMKEECVGIYSNYVDSVPAGNARKFIGKCTEAYENPPLEY